MGDEETIDDVKQAYALLFKAHGELIEERDALLDKVRDYGGRMTDEQSSTLAELDEAIAANDLPSVGTEDARRLAAMLIVHAGDHKDVAYECDMNPADTLNWKHHVTSLGASKALLTLVSERDELASRVRALEAEVLDQCRLNGMGAERESALIGRVRELEGALKECAAVCAGETMSKQGLINALEKARAALNASKEQP